MPAVRRTAVIGANGFIGSALVRGLSARGHPPALYTRSIPFLTLDGCPDRGLLAADTVFWLVSSISPAAADRQAADLGNLHRLLDALTVARERQPLLVVVSSGGTVYDPASPPPHSESARLAPANAYGAAMLAMETLVRERAGRSAVLRVANAYGPGQVPRRGQGVIAHWLAAVAAGKPVHVMGNQQVARDYVFIDDVVDALIRLHEAPDPPRLLNIGSGEPTTLHELLDRISAAVAPAPVAIEQDCARGFDAPSTWLDVSLAARVLGWRARTGLAAGLAAAWRHLAESTPTEGSP